MINRSFAAALKPSRRLLLAPLLVCALPFAAHNLAAQGTAATVSGFVTDASGAKVPGASVTLTNTATGITATATTNDSGLYRIGGLIPGTYREQITLQGFKTAVKEGIDVQLEANIELDYALDVGSTSETVTVTAENNLLEASSPTVSQVIEGRQVEDTPLNGRNTMNLVALTPGVVPQGGTQGAASNNTSGGAFTNANSFGNYSIAGGLSSQGAVFVDGAPINAIEGNVVAFVITQDDVQEFRVESSVVNPQYGQFGGGVVSFGTKPGGNSIHGTIYEYFRNTIFNANNFFNNLHGIPRPAFNQNQFGGTIGGPIKKDKAFFFASFEDYRLAQGVVNTGRVPTPAELNGDFTADPVIINPFANANGTRSQVQCGGVLNKFCIGAPVNAGDAVADPTSLYLANTLHYFPTPNAANPTPTTNFVQNGKANARNAEETIRVDYNLNPANKLFARVVRFDRTQDPTQFFNNPGGPQAYTGVGATTTDFLLGDTLTLSPTSLLDLRLSYLRYFSYLAPANTNVNLAPLDNGDQAQFWNAASHELPRYFPDISITNNATFPYTGLNQAGQQPLNLYVAAATYSKVLGKHSLSFGGEFRQGEEYFYNQPFLSGFFAFAGTTTACTTPATCGGHLVIPGSGATPEADFVAGTYASAPAGFTTTSAPSVLTHYAGIFANDTYQVSPRLTVTAGVRYELPGSFYTKNDDNAVILPQLANPLVLVNSTAYSGRGDLQAHHELFSPRVGFSFAPYAGTTFRAGYSLAFIPQDSAFNSSPTYSSINSPVTFVAPSTTAAATSSRLCAPLGFMATGTPGNNTCNNAGAIAKTAILQPTGRAGYLANPNQFFGQTITGREPFSSFPFLEQYNANVQQAFGSSTVLQLAYLGARGEHLPSVQTYDINQFPDTGIISLLPTATAANAAQRTYPLFQNVNVTSPYNGDTYYNSAQVTVTKRFNSGGTILGNYSWSKFLGTAESTTAQVESHNEGLIQDYTNLRGERSYISFDIPHRLVVSYIVDLPVGHGKRFLGNANGAVNTIVSGWNASGINVFQSGFPLALTVAPTVLSGAYGGGTPRPNFIPGCNQKVAIGYVQAAQQNVSNINKACFAAPIAFTPNPAIPTSILAGSLLGNQPRTSGILRTQGTDNWDFSVGKTTPIRENINIVFRAEAFNVFNRVQFGDPGLQYVAAPLLVRQTTAPLVFLLARPTRRAASSSLSAPTTSPCSIVQRSGA